MRIAVSLLVLSTVGACVKQPYVVTPRAIHEKVPELREHGRATVEMTPGGEVEVRTDHVFRAKFKSKAPRVIRWAMRDRRVDLSVAKLIENCPDVPPFAEDTYRGNKKCLLLTTKTKSWLIGHRTRPDWEKWKIAGTTTAMAGALLGMATCAQVCDGTAQKASVVGVFAYWLMSLPLLALAR